MLVTIKIKAAKIKKKTYTSWLFLKHVAII